MPGVFEGQGIRFDYPESWAVDVGEDGSRVTVTVSEPGGTAFSVFSLDDDEPAPANVADEALAAMREEYTQLDAEPVREEIGGQPAVGYDIEFFALDFVNACAIRSLRLPGRTVLMLQQWSETVDGPDMGRVFEAIRKSFAASEIGGASLASDEDVWPASGLGPDIDDE